MELDHRGRMMSGHTYNFELGEFLGLAILYFPLGVSWLALLAGLYRNDIATTTRAHHHDLDAKLSS